MFGSIRLIELNLGGWDFDWFDLIKIFVLSCLFLILFSYSEMNDPSNDKKERKFYRFVFYSSSTCFIAFVLVSSFKSFIF